MILQHKSGTYGAAFVLLIRRSLSKKILMLEYFVLKNTPITEMSDQLKSLVLAYLEEQKRIDEEYALLTQELAIITKNKILEDGKKYLV